MTRKKDDQMALFVVEQLTAPAEVEEKPMLVLPAGMKQRVSVMTDKEVKAELERDYLAAGWEIELTGFGWMRLVHADGRVTGESATYRGLLRHVRKMGGGNLSCR